MGYEQDFILFGFEGLCVLYPIYYMISVILPIRYITSAGRVNVTDIGPQFFWKKYQLEQMPMGNAFDYSLLLTLLTF